MHGLHSALISWICFTIHILNKIQVFHNQKVFISTYTTSSLFNEDLLFVRELLFLVGDTSQIKTVTPG